MKVTHVGHACILIQAKGLSVLSDPWWRGPCFSAQWWQHPQPYLEALEGQRLDYIYISHGHEDHLHFGTLKTLDRSARVLVAKSTNLAEHIRDLGFEVLEVDEHEERSLGHGLVCRIVPTQGGDTFMTLTDGHETVVNLNDAVHPLSKFARNRFIRRIIRCHPRIDYVFCGYGAASHFPNCYIVPGEDRERSAEKRQLFFNHSWARIIHGLKPRFGFPFAADVVLLEDDLFWSNAPVHNVERPPEVFRRLYPGDRTEVLDITSGFVIEDGKVVSRSLKSPVSTKELEETCREKIARANRYGSVDEKDVEVVRELVEKNVEKHHGYLSSFDGDYRALIRFRNSDAGLELTKRGKRVEVSAITVSATPASGYDLAYTTRLPYLRRSLTTPYGHETLFVGSGGIFEYFSADRIREHLHDELMVIVSQKGAPSSRRKKKLKRLVKDLINRDEYDMYNLRRWKVPGDAGDASLLYGFGAEARLRSR